MMTAFMPAGSGSPVSTHSACAPTRRRIGVASEAPRVSSARTAAPSIAAPW